MAIFKSFCAVADARQRAKRMSESIRFSENDSVNKKNDSAKNLN